MASHLIHHHPLVGIIIIIPLFLVIMEDQRTGVDPLAQIQERCICIVKTHQVHHEGCVLCRQQYFSKIFSPQTMMICDQCKKEYHVGCKKDHNIQNLENC
ncbi:hypothetical protein PIB30_089241 [Stylosanthes scabra]|uniref:Phorbol-ester/DAG-type domain-containing protein n=1 Tax=Stylosanthes scabra TaxID=79078 RepID=A0ABU6QU36_9FABA|nr:hypothetical protein [Stylosanthes scabra]